MKKMVVAFLMIGSMLFLTGCDIFNEGVEDMWYDEMNETLNISYSISKPDKNEETGEYPVESIHLMARYESSDEWVEIAELDDYSAKDLQIPFRFAEYGNVSLKVERRDEAGNYIESSNEFDIWINEPQYLYHFDTYFDEWSGEVRFNYGLNEMVVYTISVQKSQDGGLNWEDIFTNEPVMDENGNIKYELKYFEYVEGNYNYRMIAFREDGSELGTLNTWGEIHVSFENKHFEGDPEIWYVSGSVDPYSKNVSIWWDAAGEFESFLIEKSTDLENWEIIGEQPRIASNFNYNEEVEGEYFYRVSALKDGASVSYMKTEEALRVKEGVIIGFIDGWVEWDTQKINVSWDFYSEQVIGVKVERSLNDGPFELVGEFGGLKKMHTDENLEPGSYTYLISVLDEFGTVLDQVESKEFVVEQVFHVYHLNAWHNNSTGEIEFQFGINPDFVSNYVIEKSSDGGLSWDVFYEGVIEYNDYSWYEDYVKVYELNEGVYAYRLTGYNDEGKSYGTVYNYEEVVVNYENLNFEEPTQFHHLDGYYNIYDNAINLWWNSQGTYHKNVIEYSTDGINWELLLEVPRITQYAYLKDLADGNYFFRISAIDDTGIVKANFVTENSIRVKADAKIGEFNTWFDWQSQSVQVKWDIIKDQVQIIKIERRLADDTTYTLIGEYGALKTTVFDDPQVSGTYVYKITLLDNAGNILDEMESNQITLELTTE